MSIAIIDQFNSIQFDSIQQIKSNQIKSNLHQVVEEIVLVVVVVVVVLHSLCVLYGILLVDIEHFLEVVDNRVVDIVEEVDSKVVDIVEEVDSTVEDFVLEIDLDLTCFQIFQKRGNQANNKIKSNDK